MESTYSRNGLAQHCSYSAGFTLVELMVVLAIIGVITAVTLNSQSSFNKSLILSNTAYDIALTIRSAETFGISSRSSGSVSNTGYGAHFTKGVASSFILFADTSPGASCSTPDCKPGNYIYSSGSDSLIQTYTLGNGITIDDFCAFSAGWSCAYANGGTLNSLDIVFARPNPDARISSGGSFYTTACIKVTSSQGGEQSISIASSGAISANTPSCP